MDRENKAYQKVLKHRRECKKWGKEFCIDCFGGGLNRFVDEYGAETRKELNLPSVEEMVKMSVDTKLLLDKMRTR